MQPNTVVVLDAMGVIYSSGDDVAELLCPFILKHGGETDGARIESLYREASLGRLPAAKFWTGVGLNPGLEDDYLRLHELSPGATEFLQERPAWVSSIWCLSNDVSAWSQKLRVRFGLSELISGFVVSGDVGARKPEPAIYRSLLAAIGVEPRETVLVDDRQPNLDAAKRLGMKTILFAPGGMGRASRHPVVMSFGELRRLIDE